MVEKNVFVIVDLRSKSALESIIVGSFQIDFIEVVRDLYENLTGTVATVDQPKQVTECEDQLALYTTHPSEPV